MLSHLEFLIKAEISRQNQEATHHTYSSYYCYNDFTFLFIMKHFHLRKIIRKSRPFRKLYSAVEVEFALGKVHFTTDFHGFAHVKNMPWSKSTFI